MSVDNIIARAYPGTVRNRGMKPLRPRNEYPPVRNEFGGGPVLVRAGFLPETDDARTRGGKCLTAADVFACPTRCSFTVQM